MPAILAFNRLNLNEKDPCSFLCPISDETALEPDQFQIGNNVSVIVALGVRLSRVGSVAQSIVY